MLRYWLQARDSKGQDWYESRRDGKEGRALLKLSTKDIGGNATRKAVRDSIIAIIVTNYFLSWLFFQL